MATSSHQPLEQLLQLVQRRFRITSTTSSGGSSSGGGGGSSGTGGVAAFDSRSSSPFASFSTSNAAASALGRTLFTEWKATKTTSSCSSTSNSSSGSGHDDKSDDADLILRQRLSDVQIHPAIALAFLDEVQRQVSTTATNLTSSNAQDSPKRQLWNDILIQFLSHWVLHLDEKDLSVSLSSSLTSTLLAACIRVLARLIAYNKVVLSKVTASATASSSTTTTTLSSFRLFGNVSTMYQRLERSSTRQVLACETIQAALLQLSFMPSASLQKGVAATAVVVDLKLVTRSIVAPILTCTLLLPRSSSSSSSTTANEPHESSSSLPLLWSFVQRQVWRYWSTSYTRREQVYWLRWLLHLVECFIITCNNNSNLLDQVLLDWCEWAHDMIVVMSNESSMIGGEAAELNQVMSVMLNTLLPRAMVHSTRSTSSSHLYFGGSGSTTRVVQALSELCGQYQSLSSSLRMTSSTPLSSLAALKWLVHVLVPDTTPLTEDRAAVLNLLVQAGTCDRTDAHSILAQILLEAALPVLAHVDPYSHNVTMQQWFEAYLASKQQRPQTYRVHLLDLFGLVDAADSVVAQTDDLLNMVASIPSLVGTQLSARQQMAALLFGVCRLLLAESSSNMNKDSFAFLKSLLEAYSDLAIPLLSIVVARIEYVSCASLPTSSDDRPSNSAAATALLLCLEFLCETLAANSHCAQEIWNLVGVQWMEPHSPLTLRIALVRLYPKLLSSNKRLYRRVVDALGACLASNNDLDLRLAAAVTLSDLAANDVIRDVTDVIGWIQNLLTTDGSLSPRHTLLVHYAVLSLHFLVVAQELDFDVVVKVLNKKLCSISDYPAIFKLPLLVLENLVLLLGDGECGGDNDDDEEDKQDKRYAMSSVSPQVTAAVKALIHIGQRIDSLRSTSTIDKDTIGRIRVNVFESLAKYSMTALGVDEEGVTMAVAKTQEEDASPTNDTENRYETIRDLVVAEMGAPPPPSPLGGSPDEKSGLVVLAARLMEFEEEVLGANHWQKRGRMPQHAPAANEVSTIRSILPQTSKMKEFNETGPSAATSIALLLSSDGSKLSLLRDLADSCLDVAGDPYQLVFCVHGYMHAISRLISVRPQSVRSMISEVTSWYEIFISPDAMHLVLSCFLLFLSPDAPGDEVSEALVDELHTTVLTAFSNEDFENGDIGKICAGILAAASLRCGQLERSKNIVNQLEQSLSGYGGQQSFGAHYGLALVSLACSKYLRRDHVADSRIPAKEVAKLTCHINGFILEHIVACFESGGEAIAELVSSTKRGKISPTLVDSVLNLGPTSLQVLPEKKAAARFLFLASAASFPTLAKVNSFLLLAVFRFLESLKWGSGKGVALPSVIRACQKSRVMSDELLGQVHKEYVAAFKQLLDSDSSTGALGELEDVYFALKGVHWSAPSESTYVLPSANELPLDVTGGTLSLIASVVSIASLSCFGTARLESLSHLDENVADEDINAVVELMLDTISSNDGGKRANISSILMGLLYAISDELFEDELSRRSSKAPNRPQSEPGQLAATETSMRLDFRKLPAPQSGTVLDGIGRVIEKFCLTALPDGPDDTLLSRALLCLLKLSIPDKYSKGLLEPLARNGVARNSAIALICSQISIRRRAYSDGHSFSTLATQMCLASVEDWSQYFGSDSTSATLMFVGKLADIGSKIPTESLNDCLLNVWKKCIGAVDGTDLSLVSGFLSSMGRLLSSTAVSPKSMQVLRQVLCESAFYDLQKMPVDAMLAIRPSHGSSMSILCMYAQCVKEVPHSNLDAMNFFRLSTENPKVDVLRALLVLELIRQNYFDFEQRDSTELTSVAAWFSRSILSSSDQKRKGTFHRVACSFSSAVLSESVALKTTRLTDILDVLLLTDASNCQFVLEWLAVVCAYICSGQDHQGDLSLAFLCTLDPAGVQGLSEVGQDQLFAILIRELPNNLASIATQQKMSAAMLNHLFRVYKLWLDVGMDRNWLDCVQAAILSCYSGAHSTSAAAGAHNDGMVNLVSSILEAV